MKSAGVFFCGPDDHYAANADTFTGADMCEVWLRSHAAGATQPTPVALDLFEALLARRRRTDCTRAKPTQAIASVGATAATAYAVDDHAVPERLTPGCKAHLSGRSMFSKYAALGAVALCRHE